MTDYLEPLRCPLCGGALAADGGSLRGGAGHVYDLARAGYVNLLPPGKKNNAKTGDEREMIRARSEFLRRGFYDPIASAVAAAVAGAPFAGASFAEASFAERTESGTGTGAEDAPFRIADLGAGEGYHTCRTAALLADLLGRGVDAFGFDASKAGAEAGCRLAKSLGFLPKEGIAAPPGAWTSPVRAAVLPANIFRLPFADRSADAALSLFAPVPWAEAVRILVPGGRLAVVSAGRDHLAELRAVLYEEVRRTDFHPAPPEECGGLSLLGRRTFSFPAALTSREEIDALFRMTPFYHRTGDAGRARLGALDSLAVTAEIELSLWEAAS